MSQKGILKNKPKVYETHPEFVEWFCNKNDAKRLSYGCKEKVDWICPNCGTLVKQVPVLRVISRKHVPCKVCSDGVSYPNKYMYNLLSQLELDFIAEYSPTWIAPKRYDFYIPSKNLIIEMDGNLGHGRKTMGNLTSQDTLHIDKYKDDIAKEHGLNVIRIDCVKIDSDYIKQNILNSQLSTLLDLGGVDFLLCNKAGYSSRKMLVCNLWNESHEMQYVLDNVSITRGTIIDYLTDCAKYGLCDYNPKEQMRRSGKRNIYKACYSNSKPVICLNTKKVFDSMADAYRWLGYDPDGHSIKDNCEGKTLSAGRCPITHEKLHWMYYRDYVEHGGCDQ